MPVQETERSFAEWKAACARLPFNRSLHGRLPAKDLLPLPKFRDFDVALSAFIAQSKTGALAQASHWVGTFPTNAGFFNTSTAYFVRSESASSAISFQPFAQKLNIPGDSEIFFHADFHGDVHSLVADCAWLNNHGYLNGFQVARTNFYMIFLGDYTDRGAYGIEVLYTLLRLKVANPEQVFLARGNHEDVAIQARYGFLQEGRAKYGRDFDALKMFRAYDFLPVVIYAGSGENFIQCNHGGMEPGFNPHHLLEAAGPLRFQLLGSLNQLTFLKEHPQWLGNDHDAREIAARAFQNFMPEDPISPSTLGFMWNDFAVQAGGPQFAIDPGRAFVYGQRATQFLLENASTATQKVRAVFRGHQQSPVLNPIMRRLLASRGVYRHWQQADSDSFLGASADDLAKHLDHGDLREIPTGSVWTFNVAPDSVYGEGCGYTFDAFGILKIAPAFSDWRLQVVNIPVGL